MKLAALLNDYIAQVSSKMELFENQIDTKLNQIKSQYSSLDKKLQGESAAF